MNNQTRVLLVPSCEIRNGRELGENTLARCRAALGRWQSGSYDIMIVSGGTFLPRKDQEEPAANLMAQWMTIHGVPSEKIIIEDKSVDTYENLRFSLAELARRGTPHELTVITQLQHALRFLITGWREHGIRIRIIPVHQPAMRWSDWLKEWFLLIPYHIWDRDGTKAPAVNNRQVRHRAAQGS